MIRTPSVALAWFLVATSIGGRLGHAQSAQQAPAFEAASVKPNTSGDEGGGFGGFGGVEFRATNVTVGALIRQAFQRRPAEVVGGPSWLDTDRFDIAAKQVRLRLRSSRC